MKLKPCPFCGSEPRVYRYPTLTTVTCEKCVPAGRSVAVYGDGPYSEWARRQPAQDGLITIANDATRNENAAKAAYKTWNERRPVVRKRKLKIWNGRFYGRNREFNHVYVAAYSVADIKELFREVGLIPPSVGEIRNYWPRGCWGRAMDGIEVERGVWLHDGTSSHKPERVQPCAKK